MNQSRAYWLDLLQHTIRAFAVAMVSSMAVSSAGTAGGYLPATQVDWLGALYIGLTAVVITLLTGFTSIIIPGADPDSISFLPKKTPDVTTPVVEPPVVVPPVVIQPAPAPRPSTGKLP